MKNNQTDRILLAISICGYVLLSGSFLLMPLENAGMLPGLLFWGGLLTGAALQVVLEARRRAFFKQYNVKREKMQKPRNGLLSFGSNRWAYVADTAMIVSLVGTALAFILTKGTGMLCYGFVAATVLSFCLHCILNGRIFFHANNQNKIRQVLEQKSIRLTKEREKNENK